VTTSGGARLQILGGTTPLREAIQTAFGVQVDGESVTSLADALDTAVVVVVATKPEHWDNLERHANNDSGTCVIAVLPELDTGNFVKAFRLGADGAVWEDTPTSHLAAVTRAALRKDVVLPQPVFTAILTNQQNGFDSDGLDPADLEILDHLSKGRPQPQIATDLGYSKRTIQRRIANLCLALGASNATHAVHVATKHGYL